MRKKISVVTGSRAEYGLLYSLMKRIREDDSLELQVVATGMHLSPEFGLTYREIEDDGFVIDEKIEMLLSSDTDVGISKSIGMGIASFAELFERSRPDMLVVLGDRFEIFSAVISAFLARIPVAHLHGGELTEGAIDEAFRHSMTKMSHLHFTATERYRRRVIQLGEAPDRVFNVGALGIDNIKETPLLSKRELEEQIGFSFEKKTAMVTFHPVTLEHNTAGEQFRELVGALNECKDLQVIFTKPNADTDGRIIIDLIDEYEKNSNGRNASYQSLGKLKYLSALEHVDLVIGNSSSGIIEVPSFRKPTVNIGDRQKGRIKAGSIIDCKPEKDDIKRAIEKALSDDFRRACVDVKNPYGEGGSAVEIITIIKRELSKEIDLKKTFYDIDSDVLNVLNSKDYSDIGEANGEERFIRS